MQHKFDGTWNYFEMTHGGAAIVPGRKDDMKLTIPEDGEVDDDNSHQGGFRKIDGKATNDTVDLIATDTVKKIKRTLNGKVMSERMCNDVLHVVIAGRYKDQALPSEIAAQESLPSAISGQEEGTWVITKP
jgi:hypothetical protein